MRIGFVLVVFTFFTACIEHGKPKNIESAINDQTEKVEVKYAQGFEVHYLDGGVQINTHSIAENEFFKDSILIRTNAQVEVSENMKVINPDNIHLACQSSTYLAFLNVLAELRRVSGLCGMEYVQNDSVKKVLAANEVIEICLAEGVQMEALYQSNSDLFLIYPFALESQKDYAEKGIKTFLIAEYLETSQLARLEWIKVFGLITGRVAEANAYFEEVERTYLNLKMSQQRQEKKFIMNLPFQDSWFMPSANSVGVELIEDAGLSYFYADEVGTENILHSKETVWNDGVSADYWVIIARRKPGFNLDDLLAEEEVYKTFKSVQNKNVIFCNTSEADYFSKGVVEPHIILKDLLYATNRITNYTPTYFFRLE